MEGNELLLIRVTSILIGSTIFLLLIFGIPFIENNSYENQLKNLKSLDDYVRSSAIVDLSNVGDKIIPTLLTSLEDEEDIQFKVSVIQILGNIGSISTINTLVKHLNHENWRVRFFSAEGLGELNTSQAILSLESLVRREKNKKVVLRALLSLGKISEFNDIEFLKSLLKDGYSFENFIIKEINKMIGNLEAAHKRNIYP